MRITGGRAKGRHLASFKGLDIRPTSDKVREAIFNLIGQDLQAMTVLDLFAGTGSLGIEALSRGASWALFIDFSDKAVRLIRKNLSLCGLEPLGLVRKGDLSQGDLLKQVGRKNKFDLVFLDPPYRKGLIPPLLHDLVSQGILSSPSLVVAETSEKEILPTEEVKMVLIRERTYGETKIHLFHYEEIQ